MIGWRYWLVVFLLIVIAYEAGEAHRHSHDLSCKISNQLCEHVR